MSDLSDKNELIDYFCQKDCDFNPKDCALFPCHEIEIIKNAPSIQPTQLTDEDKETIRIHLSAFKERLCNQRRWNEAKEYEELISRLLSTPSVQPRRGKWIYSEGSGYGNPYGHYECSLCGDGYGYKTNFCPNCGADMREGDPDG